MTQRRTLTLHALTAALLVSLAGHVYAAVPNTVHLLALRVEFPYEDPDDATTGGRGTFDTRTSAEAVDETDDNENPYRYPYDTPPHDADFLAAHLTALTNYVSSSSRGQTTITWEIYPPQGEPAYVAPRDLVWYGSSATNEDQLFRWVTFLSEALDLADTDVGGFDRFNSFLVFNASISEQEALSTELPPLALTPQEIASTGVAIPPDVTSAWFMPQQIQEPGGVIGLNGTFASTFFASFGLPVLLNTQTGGSALGGWTVMDIGSDNLIQRIETGGDTTTVLGFVPSRPMAWEQQRLGWLTPAEARTDTTIRLAALRVANTSLPHAVKVPMTPDEYLLIELRQSIKDSGDFEDWDHPEITYDGGVWSAVENDFYDAYTPGSGVLIYHVDEGRIRQWEPVNEINADGNRPGIYLVEADGYRDVGIVNLLGHPRSSEGIGSPRDPFKVTGDTLYATGTWEPGHAVSMTNDGFHSGIQVVTAPYGVTGDSVEIRVSWESGEDVPERLSRHIGSPVVEGITSGLLFEAWTGESSEAYAVFATEDGNVWVLDADLEPLHSDSGVVAQVPFTPVHKPIIMASGAIRVYGADSFADVKYTSGGWTTSATVNDTWSPPTISANLQNTAADPYDITWTDSGTITATDNGATAWTFATGDSIVMQPTAGPWGDTDADGYGYLFVATPRRLYVLSRTGYEVARYDLGRADSTDSFTSPPLTFMTGAAVATTNTIRIYGLGETGEAADVLDRVILPGEIQGVPALVPADGGPTRIVAGTSDGWLYAYSGLIPNSSTAGTPVWSQLYGDASGSNAFTAVSLPTIQSPIAAEPMIHNAFCYPSPVGKTAAKVRFYLTQQATVRARVYNGVGELVWEDSIPEADTTPNAEHEIEWPGGTEFASGLYLIRLDANAADGSHAGANIPVGIVR